jgi:hypothetical protein
VPWKVTFRGRPGLGCIQRGTRGVSHRRMNTEDQQEAAQSRWTSHQEEVWLQLAVNGYCQVHS